MAEIFTYSVPDTIEVQRLLAKISQAFLTKDYLSSKVDRHYLDTFDWRLHNTGLTLYQEGQYLHLVDTATSNLVATEEWPGHKRQRFHWEFPDGELKSRLAPVLEMRAIHPLVSVTAETTQTSLLNRDIKSTSHLYLEQIYPIGRPSAKLFVSLAVRPVRGYPKKAKKIQKFALELGLTPLNSDGTSAIFSAAGFAPGSYSTKLNVHLPPSQPASLAAVAIYKSQIKIMRLNEPGIKEDIDTEFLHDFRVALRRTRAGLSQFKGVFSPEITLGFKKELALIGKMTNRMRDLDVYLLQKDYYRCMLPQQLRPKLDHLFELLSTERQREKRKVITKLNGATYKKTMARWTRFLESYELDKGYGGTNSSRQVIELARRFIFKTWIKTINKGRLINHDSPDGDLHKLRLDCKKLRYLLEFFSSLFPKDEMRFLIKQLKKLQDNLGDFNDICVQQETLQEYLEHQVSGNRDAIDVAAAIGGLITNLNHRQQEVRFIFTQTFNNFDCSKNNRQFKEIFKNGKKA